MAQGKLTCPKLSGIWKSGMVFWILIFSVLVLCSSASAAQVTLAWNANGDADLGGYNIYYGTASGIYDKSIRVGNVTTFTITDLKTKTYYLALTAYDRSGNESGYSNEISWPIQVLAPNGDGVLPSGSPCVIAWSASWEAVRFRLWFSMDNGVTWIPMNDGETIDDAESFAWDVPSLSRNKRKCLVKVAGYDERGKKVGTDESDETFMIEVLRLTSPSGGELLVSGDMHLITWHTNVTGSPVANVKVFLTKDGGKTWQRIALLEGNPEEFWWRVPDVGSRKDPCKVKVVLKDVNGKTIGIDSSDSYFTIQPYEP